ncbi:MAG: ABC transporter ATP-binding protein [Firmicutes bacterium]|nr:ABC transporter ATP-binding protein [Bacillota bacterium]
MISVKNLTMKYPSGNAGIFDIDFVVNAGEAVGFLGANGAGKTTTIRCLLGFMKGQKGECTLFGRECFLHAPKNMLGIGFIAGEPSFPEDMTGLEYLNYLQKERGQKDLSRMNELIKYFEFDASKKIKKMSKGMKQKTALVSAFMHDPSLYILDEPTSGLDPLMQQKFISLVLEEKAKGKTFLISSHIFEEVEKTCLRVIFIKDGRIATQDTVENLKKSQTQTFVVSAENAEKINISGAVKTNLSESECEFSIASSHADSFIKELSKHTIIGIRIKEQTLEDAFLNLYQANGGNA